MKKYLLATLALIPLAVYAQDPNVKAYCNNNWQTSTPGWINITSDHGATIMNKSSSTLTYDIYFDNAIQYPTIKQIPLSYAEAPYTPNAHAEYHIQVEPGKTLYWGTIPIGKVAGFAQRGRYKTSATTTVKYNGILLDQCVHYTNVDII